MSLEDTLIDEPLTPEEEAELAELDGWLEDLGSRLASAKLNTILLRVGTTLGFVVLTLILIEATVFLSLQSSIARYADAADGMAALRVIANNPLAYAILLGVDGALFWYYLNRLQAVAAYGSLVAESLAQVYVRLLSPPDENGDSLEEEKGKNVLRRTYKLVGEGKAFSPAILIQEQPGSVLPSDVPATPPWGLETTQIGSGTVPLLISVVALTLACHSFVTDLLEITAFALTWIM